MKWTKDTPRVTEEWVAKYGLMQPFGATLSEYLLAQGIDHRTHYRWLNRYAHYANAIKKGQERYKALTLKTAEQGLKQLIAGDEEEETITKYVSNAQGQPIIAERKVRKHRTQPNTAAVIFALTNLNPDQWKNRQNNDVEIKDNTNKQGMSVQEARDYLAELEKTI